MWSRAKRESGNKGARVDEEVWTQCQRAPREGRGMPDVGAGDDEMERLMDEAVERGYGSDAECKTTIRQRKPRA